MPATDSAATSSFSVLDTDLSGFASLDANVTGKALTDFSFTGGTGRPRWQLDFRGPYNDAFDLHAAPSLIVNSPCGAGTAILNINTQIALSPIAPSRKNGFIGVRSPMTFRLEWSLC